MSEMWSGAITDGAPTATSSTSPATTGTDSIGAGAKPNVARTNTTAEAMRMRGGERTRCVVPLPLTSRERGR
jgi:hypothetical protein